MPLTASGDAAAQAGESGEVPVDGHELVAGPGHGRRQAGVRDEGAGTGTEEPARRSRAG